MTTSPAISILRRKLVFSIQSYNISLNLCSMHHLCFQTIWSHQLLSLLRIPWYKSGGFLAFPIADLGLSFRVLLSRLLLHVCFPVPQILALLSSLPFSWGFGREQSVMCVCSWLLFSEASNVSFPFHLSTKNSFCLQPPPPPLPSFFREPFWCSKTEFTITTVYWLSVVCAQAADLPDAYHRQLLKTEEK